MVVKPLRRHSGTGYQGTRDGRGRSLKMVRRFTLRSKETRVDKRVLSYFGYNTEPSNPTRQIVSMPAAVCKWEVGVQSLSA